MAKLKIKKGDRVRVVTGKDRGKEGDVLKVLPGENRVVVSGVRVVQRHQKPSARSAGGIDSKEAPVHVSNVALLDPSDNKPSRVGYKVLDDGRKVRFARRSGEIIDR
jgi:large subunit ribosomal protein L24